jgi:hypothetical protein
MRTNIVLDDALTDEAFTLTGAKTKRELVELALRELVRVKKQSNQRGLCDVFEALHKLGLSDDPFPTIKRKNRINPFADQL